MPGVVDLRQIGLGPLADAGDARALAGLRADDAHRRIALLQVARHAGDGAGGAHGADEMRDASAGVGPDLRAGGLVVDAWVVLVGELVEHAALAVGHHLLGQVARVFHAAGARRQHQFGAVGLHGLRTLDRQILGHDQDHAVAEHRRGHGQRDAGIAGGGLDQRIAGLDVAALGGALNHAQRRPVLHRAGGVVALELAQDDIAARVVVGAGQALQPHQRRIADGVLQRLVARWILRSHGRVFCGARYCGSVPRGP